MSTCLNCGFDIEGEHKFCPSCGTRSPEVADPGHSLIGRTLNDKYRILSELGAGSMGSVYLAEHVRLKKKVALKILHIDLQVNDDALQRFQREGIAAGQFTHPNAIQIFDFDRGEGKLFYLAMEFVEGRSLKKFLREEGARPAAEAVALTRQILSALAEAHRHGIIHRDLKPDNIMVVDGPAGERTIKVLDFGLSKLIDRPLGASMRTQTGMIIGTPLYMSPEQCAGEPADHKSDLYAVGLILYEMMAGRLPFEGRSVSEILIERATAKAPSFRKAHPELSPPKELDAILRKALQPKPKDRFESAADMIAALDRVTFDGTSTATPRRVVAPAAASGGSEPTLVLPAIRPPRKRRLGLAVGIVVVTTVVAALGAYLAMSGAGGRPDASTRPARVSAKNPAARTASEDRYLELLAQARRALADRDSTAALVAAEEALRLDCRDAEGFLVRAQAYRQRRDLDTAIADCEEALKLDPTFGAAAAEVGWIHFDREEHAAALSSFDKALDADGASATAFTGRGATEYRLGRFESARESLENAIALDSRSTLAPIYLGRTLLQLGDVNGAISVLIQAKRNDSRSWEAYAILGEAYLSAGRFDEADAQLREAIRLEPAAAQPALSLATLLVERHRYEEAVLLLDDAVTRHSSVGRLHVLRGTALRAQGQDAAAIRALERGVELDPEDVAARVLLGILYERQDRVDDAIEQYRAALDEDDSLSEAHLQLGVALMNAGRYDEAELPLSRAAEDLTDDAFAQKAAGVLYLDYLPDAEKATQYLERYMRLDGSDARVDEWLRSLRR